MLLQAGVELLNGEVVLLGDRISIAIFPPPKTEPSLAEDILVPNEVIKRNRNPDI